MNKNLLTGSTESESAMKPYNLKPIWAISLKIYSEMDKICRRNNLRLYVSYGTALGAIRHTGPIPWDDDFDTSMPRKDLEMFLRVAPKQLPNWLKLVSYRNRNSYHHLFAKVMVSDVGIVDAVCAESGLPAPEGVFVDVFPIDGYPVSRFGRLWRFGYVSFLRGLFSLTKSNLCNRIMEWLASMISFDTAKRVTDWAGWRKEEFALATRKRAWMSPDDFGEGIDVPFGESTVRVPKNWEKYLEWWYGDWRKLPPEKDRHPDHLTALQSKKAYRLG